MIMATSLGISISASTGKSTGALSSATSALQMLHGRPLSQSCRISPNSAGSVFALSCRCSIRAEKVFGAKGAAYVCTDHSEVDAEELSSLLAASNQNCQQFPDFRSDGTVVPVDPAKLRRALRHSTVVVALYVEGGGGADYEEFGLDRYLQVPGQSVGGWLDYWKPRPAGRRSLAAFVRATSDVSLTASIYDLVVAPSYQRAGYGSLVLLRIVRELRRKGICDIAVTPIPELRGFFGKCGFAPDQLNSTTMMYTRGPTSTSQVANEVKEYGRKMFLIPPPLTPRTSTRILERSRL